jgi:hypothetical protein
VTLAEECGYKYYDGEHTNFIHAQYYSSS